MQKYYSNFGNFGIVGTDYIVVLRIYNSIYYRVSTIVVLFSTYVYYIYYFVIVYTILSNYYSMHNINP